MQSITDDEGDGRDGRDEDDDDNDDHGDDEQNSMIEPSSLMCPFPAENNEEILFAIPLRPSLETEGKSQIVPRSNSLTALNGDQSTCDK